MSSGKRKLLTLQERVEVLECKGRMTVQAICEKFGIKKTQVYTIFQEKESIMDKWLQGNSSLSKRRTAINGNEKINELTWEWFVATRAKNVPISGPILQAKGTEIARKLGNSDFKASNGWLESFKKRHQVTCKTVCGEAKDSDHSAADEWLKRIPDITSGYNEMDIFNCDETALFFRMVPTKTLTVMRNACVGGKLSKERLTVLLCCNAKGQFQRPLVIGKAQKPRCFKNLNIRDLPVEWKANKKAWMTAAIMEEWLRSFDAQMVNQKRKVLLFLDNATCHPHVSLQNVKLCWLPGNTTSLTQPLDQGIIYAFKLRYRALLMQSLLAHIDACDSVTQLTKSITVLDAVHWISKSCKELRPSTAINCFRKAGFRLQDGSSIEESIADTTVFQDLLNEVNLRELTAEEFVNCDKQVPTEDEHLWDEQLNSRRQNLPSGEDESSGEEEEEAARSENPIKTYCDALMQIKNLKDFFASQNNSEILNTLNAICVDVEKEAFLKKKTKQKSLLDYFL